MTRRSTPESRRQSLLLSLCALFVGFFVTAELLGAKLWRFTLLGTGPSDYGLGENGYFIATAGILAFPLTFILTDIVNEYFGRRIVRVMTFLAIAVNLLLQPVVQGAIRVPGVSLLPGVTDQEIQNAYRLAFGQTWAIVAGSLIAFGIAQLLDAHVFTWLRRRTGGKLLWLRAQGSTVVSQLIDTFAVIFLAFVVIPGLTGQAAWGVSTAAQVSLTNYVYKFVIAVAITPLLYLVHASVDAWLGKQTAQELVHAAHPRDPD